MPDNPILEEYRLCHEATSHIDEHNWMWGSFLFGGSLAAVGLVFSQHVGPLRLLGLAAISSAVLGGYVLMVRRTIPFKDAYFLRMRQIETQYLQYCNTARTINRLIEGEKITSDNPRKTIQLPWPRRFEILVAMVVTYLMVLWFGAGFLLLTKGLR